MCRFDAATARTRTFVSMVRNVIEDTAPWSIRSVCSSTLVSLSSWSQGDRLASKLADFGFVIMLSQQVITSSLRPSIWRDFAYHAMYSKKLCLFDPFFRKWEFLVFYFCCLSYLTYIIFENRLEVKVKNYIDSITIVKMCLRLRNVSRYSSIMD